MLFDPACHAPLRGGAWDPERGDALVEPDETAAVSLSAPATATLGDATAALTITDDDPLALSVAGPSVTEGDGGTTPATFTVALDAAPRRRSACHSAARGSTPRGPRAT